MVAGRNVAGRKGVAERYMEAGKRAILVYGVDQHMLKINALRGAKRARYAVAYRSVITVKHIDISHKGLNPLESAYPTRGAASAGNKCAAQ